MSNCIKELSCSAIFEKLAPLTWEQDESAGSVAVQICNYGLQFLTTWDHPKNFGQFWRLYWNRQPGAQIMYQDKVYDMTPDSVFLIPSHIATSTRLNNRVEHFSVNFKVNGKFEKIKHKVFMFPPDMLHILLAEFAKLTDEDARQMVIRSIVSFYLSRLTEEDFQLSEYDDLDPRIAQAARILEAEFANPPSNDELSHRVGMSRNNFYRLFMRETKKTPKFFLMELRMIRASNLLTNTQMTLDEIAAAVGYSNRYHFSRVFREFSENSPIRFRKKLQSERGL